MEDGDEVYQEPPMPSRYLVACDGAEMEARRRWKQTCLWRKANNIDLVLESPQQHFYVIRACYPHFYHRRSRSGCLVFFEQCGRHRLETLFNRYGVTAEIITDHYIFLSEFVFKLVDKEPDAKLVTIYDLQGARLTDLTGKVYGILRSVMKIYQDFYPERSLAILVVNAPWWFTQTWKALKPFISLNTQQKVCIVNEEDTFDAIMTHLDPFDMPAEYGGKSTDPLGSSEVELQLRTHVLRTCIDAGVEPLEMPPDVRAEWYQMLEARREEVWREAGEEEDNEEVQENDNSEVAGESDPRVLKSGTESVATTFVEEGSVRSSIPEHTDDSRADAANPLERESSLMLKDNHCRSRGSPPSPPPPSPPPIPQHPRALHISSASPLIRQKTDGIPLLPHAKALVFSQSLVSSTCGSGVTPASPISDGHDIISKENKKIYHYGFLDLFLQRLLPCLCWCALWTIFWSTIFAIRRYWVTIHGEPQQSQLFLNAHCMKQLQYSINNLIMRK